MLEVVAVVMGLIAGGWALALAWVYTRCELRIRELQRVLARREREEYGRVLPIEPRPRGGAPKAGEAGRTSPLMFPSGPSGTSSVAAGQRVHAPQETGERPAG